MVQSAGAKTHVITTPLLPEKTTSTMNWWLEDLDGSQLSGDSGWIWSIEMIMIYYKYLYICIYIYIYIYTLYWISYRFSLVPRLICLPKIMWQVIQVPRWPVALRWPWLRWLGSLRFGSGRDRRGKTMGKPWENHRKTIGKWRLSGIWWGFTLW